MVLLIISAICLTFLCAIYFVAGIFDGFDWACITGFVCTAIPLLTILAILI